MSVLPLIDKITLKLVKKAVSQRSGFIQGAVLFFLAFAAACLVWRLLSLQKGQMIQVLCLVSCFVLIGILCSLQTLRRDDYWEIRDVYKYGFPGYIQYEFVHICGRYFSQFIKSLYLFFPPVPYINILLFLTFIFLCIGFYELFRIFPGQIGKTGLFLCGTVTALGLIFMSPNIWEVWFWGGGTFIYGIGTAFVVMAAALMIGIRKQEDHSGIRTLAAGICILCACGTSELNAASICVFAFLIYVIPGLFNGHSWNKRNACLCLLAWSVTAFVLFASGNMDWAVLSSGHERSSIRELLSAVPGRGVLAIQTLIRYAYSRIEFVLVFALLAFLIGLCFPDLLIGLKQTLIAVLGLILTAIIDIMINLMIGYMPPRVVSIPLGWIMLALMLAFQNAGARLRTAFWKSEDPHIISALVPLIMLTVVFWF